MPKPNRQPLIAEFVRSVLDYDPATGIFRWRHRNDRPRKWNSRYAGKIAGSDVKGYVQIQLPKPRNYYAHILAWLYVHGEWRPDEVDHANGIRSDNRISNLRLGDHSDNACNKATQSNNTSGYTGVQFHQQTGKWRARIQKNGIDHSLGLFTTAEEAADARRQAAIKIHGEFARI